MATWSRCGCCSGDQPKHAMLQLKDMESGELFATRVPHEHRHDSVGWGDRPRIGWKSEEGEDLVGLEHARGKEGVTLVDDAGNHHRVLHGKYEVWGHAPPEMWPMEKAKDLRPGQRWITVHPRGRDEKGVPVLIEQNPDKSYRIVAGAGGKLTHLRLTGIKSEEEYAEEAKERGEKKREKEKERKEKQAPEERKKERVAKADVEARVRLAERDHINKVRSKMGGVDEDIDETRLHGLSDAAKNVILGRHHRKQLRQAMKRTADAAEKLVEHETHELQSKAALEQAAEEDPELGHARELASSMLELKAQEEEELRVERRARRSRSPGGKRSIEAVQEVAATEIAKTDDPADRLKQLGGRDDDEDNVLRQTLTASEELERRSLQELQDAQKLLEVASGKEEGEEVSPIVQAALKRAGVDEGADEEVRADALRSEAARKFRRHEVLGYRKETFEEMEHTDGFDKALNRLRFSDIFADAAKAASTAKEMGLTDTDHVPLHDAETAELIDVLEDEATLRMLRAEYRKMNKAIEKGDYDRSRRAFDLSSDEVSDRVVLKLNEQVQRRLTERLLGVANQRDQNYLSSVGNAHYAALADVSLGIAGQRYLDRPTVDAVGAKNASILTRWALAQDGHDEDAVLGALESEHVKAVEQLSAKALQRADEFVPGLTKSIDDVGSLEEAVVALDAHEADLEDVQRTVAAAIGRMEATATLGQAYRQELPDSFTVQAGDVGLDGTLQWMHAIGLTPQDYSVDYEDKVVNVPQSSWSKLVEREAPEVAQRRQEVAAIKRGERDEDGWLPAGFIRRESSSFTDPVPESPRYWKPLDLQTDDLAGELDTHVGRRLADGEPADHILHDLLSPAVLDNAPDRDAVVENVKRLFPLRDDEGNIQKPEFFREHYEGLAQKWADESGLQPHHAQDLQVEDPGTSEAVFRTLSENPTWKHAFTPVGELDHDARRALRDHFYERQGIGATRSYDDQHREAMERIGPEPPRADANAPMFGPAGDSPDWVEWKKRALDVARKYPKQGRELAQRLLATERPESRRLSTLTDENIKLIDQAVEELPHATAETIWRRLVGPLGWRAPSRDEIRAYLAPELHQREIARFERRAKAASTPWAQYVDMHGSPERGLESLQHELRGSFATRFQDHYGKITGRSIITAPEAVPNQETHIQAIGTPEEQARFRALREKQFEALRQRDISGRYAEMGGRGGLIEAHRKEMGAEVARGQLQSVMFGTAPQAEEAPALPEARLGERVSMGERAENQIASLIPHMGRQMEAGKPFETFPGLAMDRDRVIQQRAVKAFEANNYRMGGYLGTGTGKTPISIGAFTQMHEKGIAKKGLFLVPVAVEQQFGSELLKFTEPGKYSWGTGSGRGHEGRVKMLQDDSHMAVMTHQAFRDTALKLMEEHHGKTRDEMLADLGSVDRATAAQWMRDAFKANGITEKLYTYFDEAHMGSSRTEDRSGLALVTDMVTHPINSSGMLDGTATPHKNDEGELYSMAARIDPEKYGDRAKFMAAFGEDIRHSPDAIRRELAHQTYSEKIDPSGVDRLTSENPQIVEGKKVGNTGPLKLNDEHRKLVDNVTTMYERARNAWRRGDVDVEAVKALAPGKFAGQPEERHEEIARKAGDTLAMSREHAYRRAINQAPPEINTKVQRMTEVIKHDLEHGTWKHSKTGEMHTGKPSIVFTDSKREVEMLTKHLADQGVRAVAYHGALSSEERDRVRLGYQPERGEPKHDVIVATSAAEAGINLQRAKVVHHFDVPQTAKSWTQRTGRAYRQKQRGDVDVHDWHSDAEFEQNARRRLRRKEGLASVFETPLGSMDETGIASAYQREYQRRHANRDIDGEVQMAAK